MSEEKMQGVLRKMSTGREYRKTAVFEVRDAVEPKEAEESRIVEGYATIFDEPYLLFDFGDYAVYEIVDRNAFAECDMSDVIMQYDHEGRVFARISNGTLEVTPDEKGLFVHADLSGTEAGRELFDEIKGGYTTKMSFGFCVAEDVREYKESHDTGRVEVTRKITKISKLYDVSAVSIPANDATEISARSYCDGVIAELEAERLKSAAIEEARAKALAAINKYRKESGND